MRANYVFGYSLRFSHFIIFRFFAIYNDGYEDRTAAF